MVRKSDRYESKCAPFGMRLKAAIYTATLCGFAGLCGVGVLAGRSAVASQAETAQESWRTEFDNICAKTENAMTFPEEELADLIRRCDALQPQIQKLDESRRKVYLERLRKCRGLYAYVLEAKKKEKK
jgi:hypothetical protein